MLATPKLRPLLTALAILAVESSARAQESTPDVAPEQTTNSETAESLQEYQLKNRHRTAGQSTSLLNSTVDYGTNFYELDEQPREADPDVRLLLSQLKYLYKPKVSWSAYAGGLVESSGYAGLTMGASLDIVAPLCRYLGAEANGVGFSQNGLGLSYDTRATACLPWGPFSIEFALLRQRDLRVALKSAPSLPSARYSSNGFDIRIRGFRWFGKTWDAAVNTADFQFKYFSAPGDATVSQGQSFDVKITGFQFRRYGKGFLGNDRIYSAVHGSASGFRDITFLRLSAFVSSISLFKFQGVPIGQGLFLDADLSAAHGEVNDTDFPTEPLAQSNALGVDVKLSFGTVERHGSIRISRRLLPDSDFRIIRETRAEILGQFLSYDDRASLSLFSAYSKQLVAASEAEKLTNALSYGVEGKYGRYAFGPFYMQLTTTAARSYYATIGGTRLQTPEFELRALVSLIASDGS